MKTFTSICLFGLTLLMFCNAKAQDTFEDSTAQNRKSAEFLLIPTSLIALGPVFHYVEPFKTWSVELRDALCPTLSRQTEVDNYIQLLPLAAFTALEFTPIEKRGDWVDHTTNLALGYGFMAMGVLCLKDCVRFMRPDSSAFNSFPSGHTATAFVAAELIRHTYWEASPLLGLGAYIVASSVGVLRMYNSKHWLGDVLCGAGIGILSARLAIMFTPYLRKFIRERVSAASSLARRMQLSPFTGYKSAGLSFNLKF